VVPQLAIGIRDFVFRLPLAGGKRYGHLIAYSAKDTFVDLQRKIKEAYPAATCQEMTYYYDPGTDEDNETAILCAHQYPYFQQRAVRGQVHFVESN
jgi:hypothetical protein